MPVPAVDGLTAFEEIGRGGFGVVYRARQDALGREVAVKVLPGVHRETEAYARFERECRALGSVGAHPNIATVYGCGITRDGEGYLAMELLEGGCLADRVAAAPLPWPEVARIGIALSGALESAHRLGVLHRDIKPQNVLFDRLGTPKLLDFGIASVPGAYQTRTSAGSLTLAHAAPEVVAGGRASVASDIYALGSTLWTAVAGAAPFVRDGEDSLVPLLARIAASPVPDLEGVPPMLHALLAKALAKDPVERPASAEELGTGLAYVLRSAGEVVDGPAVLTPSARAAGVPAPEPVAESAERTRARDAVPALPVPVPAAVEEEPRRRRQAMLAVALVLLLGILAVAGLLAAGRGAGDPLAAAADSSEPGSLSHTSAAARGTSPTQSAAGSSHGGAAGRSSGPDTHRSSGAGGTALQGTTTPGGGTGETQRSATSPAHPSSAPSRTSTATPSTSLASSPTRSPTSSPTSSPSSPSSSPSTSPPVAPGVPLAGSVRMVRRATSSIRLELAWGAPTTGGSAVSYDVRRTLMHGTSAAAAPAVVVHGFGGLDLRLSAPLVPDTQGWYRWQVRARGPGGLSAWHLLRVRLVTLSGRGCSPAVLGMRSSGLRTTAHRLAGGQGVAYYVAGQSLGAGLRRPGKALVLTCAKA